MLIRNKFQKKEIGELSSLAFRLIKNEPELTNRSLGKITSWMKDGFLYIALSRDQILGFIARERIADNFYEVKSLLVKRNYRKKGLGDKLIKEAVKDKKLNYLMSTFQGRIVKKTAKFGFKQTSFIKLPLKVSLTYILKKNLGSVLKHGLKKRSFLLIKYASN